MAESGFPTDREGSSRHYGSCDPCTPAAMDAYMSKPVRMDALGALLMSLLAKQEKTLVFRSGLGSNDARG